MARIDNIINANSSYSKDVSGVSLQRATLNMWIYSGAQGESASQGVNLGASGDRLATPTYTLSSSAVSYNGSNIVSFDIAPLVKDYLDPSTSDLYSGNNSVWVDIQITSESGNITSIGSSEHYLGQDGYDYSSEVQGQLQTISKISNSEMLMLEDDVWILPIDSISSPILTLKDQNGGTIDNDTIGSSLESNNQIRYIEIDDETKSIEIDGYVYGSELIPSTDLTSASWFAFGSPSNTTIISDNQLSPILDASAYKVTSPAGNGGFVSTNGIDGIEEGKNVTISAYLKGSGTVRLRFQELGDNYTVYFEKTFTLTSSWRHYSVTGIKAVDGNPPRMIINRDGDNALDVSVFRPSAKQATQVSEVINITKVCQTKYQPTKLTFVNKMGAFQDVWMFANSKQKLQVKSENWNRRNQIGSSSITRATNVRNVSDVKQSLTLNSGFYPENNNVVFEELMQSNNVWMTQDDLTLPIVIKDTNFNFKDSMTDKMINYTLSIEYAFNKMRSL